MKRIEKNLEILAECYPQMDKLIEKAKRELKQDLEIIEEVSNEGTPILRIKREGRECYLNGKRNTEEPAKMWVQGLGELVKNAPIFMMGVGNATYLKELVEHSEKHITIIIYEPSLQIFLKFLEEIDLEKLMNRHLLIFWVDGIEGMNEENMSNLLSPLLKYELLPFSRNIILPNYEVLFPEKALFFMKTIRNLAFFHRVTYNTQSNFSGVFVKNILGNLPYILDAYKTTQLIEVIPRDIPGIVVAAGPSLNKNIEDLRLAKGKAFIVAVDTAIKPLLNAGIIPDMFAIVDGEKPLSLIEREEAKRIPLVGTLCSANEIFRYHNGMKFLFNEGYQYAENIYARAGMPVGTVSSGGSVATNIFSLLYKIGLKCIILVGQDLALTDNKTHADGTFHEKMEEIDTSRCIKVKGNYEKEVYTRGDLKMYLDWYNEHIEACKNNIKELRVINATEGGAKIQNTEIMTLKEAIKSECKRKVDIQECLHKLSPMLNEENRKWSVEFIKGIPKEFRQLYEKSKSAQKLYRKLDKICNKRNVDKRGYLSIMKKIGRIVNDIEERAAYQLVNLTLMNAEFILKNEEFIEEDSLQKEGKEIARKGILYMENVAECATLFEGMMNDVLENNEVLCDVRTVLS